MLQLINYDISGGKKVYDALANAVNGLANPAGACHRVPGGPWLLRTQTPVEDVLIEVDTAVARAQHGLKQPTRRLLALTLTEDDGNLVGAHRELAATAKWLRGTGFPFRDEGWFVPRVLAIDFALHGASSGDNQELRNAIWHRFHGCCNPLHTLWLVETSLAPQEVCRYLEDFIPDRKADKENPDKGTPDELLVVEVRGPAVESGLDRVRTDIGWLWENGVPVKHRRAPRPVAHKKSNRSTPAVTIAVPEQEAA